MAGDSSEGQGLLYSSQQARAAKPAGDGSDDRAQLLESTSPAARARPSCCALVSAIVTLHVALLACIGAILAVAIIAVVCVFFLAAEPASFRPRFHITPPSGWMNDPTGLMQYRGVYHLFYQHNPYAAVWGNIRWGHVISTDLVRWTHMPDVLAPQEHTPFAAGSWSGGAGLGPDNRPFLFFTGVLSETLPFNETQCTAAPADPTDPTLRDWTPSAHNPLIAEPPLPDLSAFRDPTVWQNSNSEWFAIIGAGYSNGNGGVLPLYRSSDTIKWEYVHPLFEQSGPDRDFAWECPSFFEVGGQACLIVSILPARRTQYWCGVFDKDTLKFKPSAESAQVFDYGSLYAARSFIDETGRVIAWGWVNETRSTSFVIQEGWAGVQSLPRQLFITSVQFAVNEPPHMILGMRPVDEIVQLRSDGGEPAFSLAEPLACASPEILLIEQDFPFGETAEIRAQFIVLNESVRDTFGLVVRADPDLKELTTVTFDLAKHTISVNRTRSSIDINDVESTVLDGEFVLAASDYSKLDLRVFIDVSLIEVFVNNRFALTCRIYPSLPTSTRIGHFGGSSQILLSHLEVWKLAMP